MSDLNFNDLTSNLQEIGKDAILGMKARNLLTTFDLFIIGMINRNLSLIEAVSYLHSQKNLIAVIPLLRIVLDSNLRLIGVFHCSDPFVYIEYFTKGESIRKLKSKDGQRLTDSYLVKKFSEMYPDSEDLYKKASGFVHYSNSLLWRVIKPAEELEEDETGYMVKIGIGKEFVILNEEDWVNINKTFIDLIDIFNLICKKYQTFLDVIFKENSASA
ncbi:hypothetical protein LEP1GSC021_4714 [Leptospira noguchii str. 1993005606]|uniref:Uncharacterized protein n=1 Tax=Leptospira noguchii str. 2007001578 TaxID=1049974 RepID=A0ABN0J7H5_9LEPT|nr:hypothetical protein [Leptospira noguchii]EMN02952.1 hypothetical protein LEP1GSC035_3814 [Leptospira noguchii str. 2007001578]EPE86584.1 hypothetical protein LEP1GSC021_4714 [Leptospira noguchii str. 1993005606]